MDDNLVQFRGTLQDVS